MGEQTAAVSPQAWQLLSCQVKSDLVDCIYMTPNLQLESF